LGLFGFVYVLQIRKQKGGNMNNFLFWYDLETTGLDSKKNGVHEISFKLFENENQIEWGSFRIKPFAEDIIEEAALNVSGVTLEQIQEYKDAKETVVEIVKQLKIILDGFKAGLSGYNINWFDNKFLNALFLKCSLSDEFTGLFSPGVDLYDIAKNKMKLKPGAKRSLGKKWTTLRSLKLKDLYFFVTGEEAKEEELHNAEYDLDLTIEIYKQWQKEGLIQKFIK
jgi:DNA polymerase III alpha subunit (gram-positive type)